MVVYGILLRMVTLFMNACFMTIEMFFYHYYTLYTFGLFPKRRKLTLVCLSTFVFLPIAQIQHFHFTHFIHMILHCIVKFQPSAYREYISMQTSRAALGNCCNMPYHLIVCVHPNQL